MDTNTLFLGLIALGVLVTASIQVAAILYVGRAARRVGDAIGQLQQDVKPITASLRAMSADAAHVASVAATQVDRIERLVSDLSRRIEAAAAAVEDSVITPARDVLSMLRGLGAAFAAFRGPGDAPRRPGKTGEDDDALFIG